jgi:hypothetical protein
LRDCLQLADENVFVTEIIGNRGDHRDVVAEADRAKVQVHGIGADGKVVCEVRRGCRAAAVADEVDGGAALACIQQRLGKRRDFLDVDGTQNLAEVAEITAGKLRSVGNEKLVDVVHSCYR